MAAKVRRGEGKNLVTPWPPLLRALGAGAAGLAYFAAKIGSEHFHSAAHFVQAGAHAPPDAIAERVLAHGNALAPR